MTEADLLDRMPQLRAMAKRETTTARACGLYVTNWKHINRPPQGAAMPGRCKPAPLSVAIFTATIAGASTHDAISEAIGTGGRSVSYALKRLVRDGYLVRPDAGKVYTITPAGRAYLEART
jgi:hypothetical protein